MHLMYMVGMIVLFSSTVHGANEDQSTALAQKHLVKSDAINFSFAGILLKSAKGSLSHDLDLQVTKIVLDYSSKCGLKK